MKNGLGCKVLIVEDDPDVASALSETLTGEGFEVETAGNAEDGLSRLGGGGFKLVIADYNLPGRTGTWMLQEAAKTGLLAASKVLLVTGESNPEGVSGLKVLKKPLLPDLFLREVFAILAPPLGKELEPDEALV
jgi:DNA-binding response OmpR family regulator